MSDRPRPDLPTTIAEIVSSGARFFSALTALTDADMRAASALPTWTRGHVVSHVARGADAYVWLLTVARTGAEPSPRAGAAALAQAVDDGAARPATQLLADVRSSLDRVVAEATSMDAGAWDTLVTALAGWRHPAWYTLYRCWRELETHHVDLNVGYTTSNWPTPYVTWALNDTVATVAARGFPVARVEAVDIDRSWTLSPTGPTIRAPGHVLLGWLSGRLPAASLVADGPVPEPPGPWPLPPTPGWGRTSGHGDRPGAR
ncbi:maleylpyruvate isomerase family mycothiol-dependent enzyme [Streptomyces sp. NPDC046712]|uniref:maleylpyruvate isomerase family mycothiol-dependent enzyme n=1 Tax=Streptomyces sp. NPDC046712 TaxID=3154802 RepID=UPI003409E1F2